MSWKSSEHEGVFVSDVEAGVPPYISNDFKKYANPRLLAKGGKAIVQVYKDTNLGRNVVVKVLRPEFQQDKQELKRLLREARITAQLQHPGTVPVYELGQDHMGQYYFTMKKVQGVTLFEIIVRRSKKEKEAEETYSLDRLLNVYLQTCDTLAYAHARGVIHRDVKPENILVGRFGEAILLDWGVAKVWGMPNEGDTDSVLQRGGSPLYMSPEQVLGHRMIDERTDIFSMGIVLYEILALREPFRGENVKATFDNIVNEDPIPPSQRSPDQFVPRALEEICLKAMNKDPSKRFQSVMQLADAIHTFRKDALMRGSV